MKYIQLFILFAIFISIPSISAQEPKVEETKQVKPTPQKGQPPKSSHFMHKSPHYLGLMDLFTLEEQEKLKELKKSNYQEYRKLVNTRMLEVKKEKSDEDKKVLELRNQYLNSTSMDERAAIKKAITEITKKQFSEKMEYTRRHLEYNEKRLKELREKFEVRKKNADLILEQRVNDLLRDPELNW
jgi:hypothetical protein